MPITLPPIRDYKAARAESLCRYRRRIAEHFDFERTRERMRGSAVDAVAREVDLTARRRAIA